jgi:hypothetical protein
MLSGWGYDVCGLPVPNAEKETVQTGVRIDYEEEKVTPLYGPDPSGKYKFHPKASTRRNLWKSGPVDLRWHDKRKVWTAGHETLEGYLLEYLSAPDISGYTTAKMSVLRIATPDGLSGIDLVTHPPSALYNEFGRITGVVPAKTENEYITITNRDPSLSASTGSYCIVMDLNYEWRPIYVGCSNG